jgi:hypothetical protein
MTHKSPLPNDAVIDTVHFKTLSFRNRLRILFGYNLLIKVSTRIHRRQGEVEQGIVLALTRNASHEDQLREEALKKS